MSPWVQVVCVVAVVYVVEMMLRAFNNIIDQKVSLEKERIRLRVMELEEERRLRNLDQVS